MTALLAEPFTYGYMVNAMWVSALVGGVCAFLSAYLMLKGLSKVWPLSGQTITVLSLAVFGLAVAILRPAIGRQSEGLRAAIGERRGAIKHDARAHAVAADFTIADDTR